MTSLAAGVLDDHGHGHNHDETDPHSHGSLDDVAGPRDEVSQHSSDEAMHKGADIEAQRLSKEGTFIIMFKMYVFYLGK